MNEQNLREQLEIDTKLELIKEHKCCAESILCIETYMYRLEQRNQQLKEQMVNLYKEFKLKNVTTATEHKIVCFQDEIHKSEVSKLREQLQQKDKVIDEAIIHIKKNTRYYDPEYSEIYGELCDIPGTGDIRTHVVLDDEKLLSILYRYKGGSNEKD
ncbi:MAG: hypothetical protein K2M17_03365 [Bacilli bacterium]|nr:hypothetical protein [Bacilli bacterium]